jgi:hypothetical protein
MAVACGVNDPVEYSAGGLPAVAMPASMKTTITARQSFQVFTIRPLVACNNGILSLFSEKMLPSEEQTD